MEGKIISFFFLIGCAVRCDNTGHNKNYVIQMPDEETQPQKETSEKPFLVYWNVPTMQCKSKRIPFENLYEKYGIIQNTGDSFRGNRVAILYDPGLFPALLKNESSGKLMFRNGGVPQEGDLEKHIDEFKRVLNQSIPDPYFDGVGIIDFESWRPVFRQNFGVLTPYKDISIEIERKRHWWWMKEWIQSEARSRFEESARAFMQNTLSLARQLRPRAVWGYYGFPYCFNGQVGKNVENCADGVPQENDRTYWLWAESTALYPSVYSSSSLDSNQLAALIRGRVHEAARVARGNSPILPYFWFRYRDGGYLSQKDLKQALHTMYRSNATGFIIWGSSNDVNSVDKCNNLLDYVHKTFGPAIAKYTKSKTRIDEYFNDDETPNDIDMVATTTVQETISKDPFETSTVTEKIKTTSINQEPESYWVPPETYAQDIVKYVEDQFVIKKRHNFTVNVKNTENVLKDVNETVLLDLIVKTLADIEKVKEHHSSEYKDINMKIHKDIFTSTVLNDEFTSTDVVQNIEVTTLSDLDNISPLIKILNNENNNIIQYKVTDPSINSNELEFATPSYAQSTEFHSTENYSDIMMNFDGTTENFETLFDDTGNYSSTTDFNYGTEIFNETTQAEIKESNQILVKSNGDEKYIEEESTINNEYNSDLTSTTEIIEVVLNSTNHNKLNNNKGKDLETTEILTVGFTDGPNTITTEIVNDKTIKEKNEDLKDDKDKINDTIEAENKSKDGPPMELTANTDQVNIYL